jgi:hypothetical protein
MKIETQLVNPPVLTNKLLKSPMEKVRIVMFDEELS